MLVIHYTDGNTLELSSRRLDLYTGSQQVWGWGDDWMTAMAMDACEDYVTGLQYV